MITATCINKIRNKNGVIKGYELQDCNGVRMRFSSEQVKQAIFLQQLTVTNLKLTSDGRLIDNNDSSNKPIPQSNNINTQNLQKTSNVKECINKIKNMMCYEWAQLTPDKIVKLIEILSECKVKKLDFVTELYYIHNIPLAISVSEFINCREYNSLSRQLDYCRNECEIKSNTICDMWTAIDFPINDNELEHLELNSGYHEFMAHDKEELIKLLSMWKNIPKCNISYGDISYAIYELMLKYVDTKYATVNNVLKLSTHQLPGQDTEYDDIKSFVIDFKIDYSEKVIIPSWRSSMLENDEIKATIISVVLYVTKEGYKLRLISYNHEIVNYKKQYGFYMSSNKYTTSEITIGFNDNLESNMKKVKILIDGEFKSSLKETKDLAKVMKHKATH